jgi:hypothetical protein
MATNRNITQNNDTHVSKASSPVQKRFKLGGTPNDKVEQYRRIMSVRWSQEGKKEEPTWVEALEEVIDTHQALKKLKI